MSYVVALPEAMSAAAANVTSIGSAVATANQSVAGATTGVLAAAEDEVSAAIAALFAAHGESYQVVSSQVAALHEGFAQALAGAPGAYGAAEAASTAPLAAFEQVALGVQRIPTTVAGGLESLASAPSTFLAGLRSGEIPPFSWILGNSPPPLLNAVLGQTVSYTTYEGMSVVQITPAHPTGEYVVAIHGGAFVLPPSIFHWVNYSVTSYMTGATVQVPIYPLVQQGGSASMEVPRMASLISSQIALHGAQNVSVTGDSAGGNLALAAVQHLVSQGAPVPSAMVLLSPWLDVGTGGAGQMWAGNLSVTNPMVSPLYGSLAGLPPTYVYSGSFDSLSAQASILQQNAAAIGAPFHFVLFPGGIHDWVILTPFGLPYWPLINQNLGIAA